MVEKEKERLNEICTSVDIKPTRKNRILVKKIVQKVGFDTRKIKIALKKASIAK